MFRRDYGFIQLFAEIDRAFGRLDVLVNNAGMIARQSRLEDLRFERMQRIFAVNAIGPLLCAQQAAKRMSHRHGGRDGVVINVSSASARLGSPNEYADYGTVPELVAGDKVEHAFALSYSGTLGSSAPVPVALGAFGDSAGPSWATAVGASAALCVIP